MIVTLLRKAIDRTIVDTVLEEGCGALNIDASRISTSDNLNGGAYAENPTERGGQDMWTSTRKGDSNCFRRGGAGDYEQPTGRWPANFILTHLEGCISQGEDWVCVKGCPVKELDQQSGNRKTTWVSASHKNNRQGDFLGALGHPKDQGYNDEGGASRFFKQLKTFEELVTYLTLLITPPQKDANVFMGDLDELLEQDFEDATLHGAIVIGDFSEEASEHLFSACKRGAHIVVIPYESYDPHSVANLENIGFEVRDSLFVAETEAFLYSAKASKKERQLGLEDRNPHPTVKPIAVMEWCLRDLSKDTKVVLDPFTGSGTTGIATLRNGYEFIGCELDKDFAKIAKARIKHEQHKPKK